MKIGKRIFYDRRNGEILAIVGERSGHVRPTTVEEDIESFPKLQERNRETLDYIDLEYGQYKEDFERATSVSVDLDTQKVVFNYEGAGEKPVYQEPLTEKVERLEKENEELSDKTTMLGALLTQERLNNVKKSFEITQLSATVDRLEADVETLKGGDA